MNIDLPPREQDEFSAWMQQVLKPRVLALQIRADVFDHALGGSRLLLEVLQRQEQQKEFSLPIWEYLDIAASDERARNGRQMLRRYRDLFIRIEQRFGVEPEVIAAIWGLESGYGTIRGSTPILPALATLAFRGRRGGFFEDELVAALRLIQTGQCRPQDLVGSWAGAIGHGQFMPSSVLAFAQDFDGDGRLGLTGDDPTDALASIANYLAKHGWRKGQPWGFAVDLPEGFDFGRSGLDQTRPSRDWARAGVTVAGGTPLPDYGPGSVLLPAGAGGVAFLVLRNFHVLLRYNRAEAYALGIGLLAERIGGAKPLEGPWPTEDRMLPAAEIGELQLLLSELGHETHDADGLRGPRTTRAVRSFQRAEGLVEDGYISAALLDRLRRRAAESRR